MRIGKKEFDTDRHTYVMGILNVTPDSFSDGGKRETIDDALSHCEQMILDGAEIIDVGGESTRPGHEPVSAREEMERVLPVIEAIKKNFDIPLSLDTMKSQVAREGITAGIDLVNDIWGLKKDPDMANLIAESRAACCLMHNSSRDPDHDYTDFLSELKEEMAQSLDMALKAGIREDGIILDPGIGFGKNREQDLQAIGALGDLRDLGAPLLLGVSRKRVIDHVLHLPIDQRDPATAVISAYAAMNGCGFVRVHEVRINADAIRMVEAIRDSRGI